MTSTAHTPGPWMHVAGLNPLTKIIIQQPYLRRLELVSPNVEIALVSDIGAMETEANANLIAAAPELLAALEVTLQQALGWYDECRGNECDFPWVTQARAAIAKAKGETDETE